jgi:hypothetical protein
MTDKDSMQGMLDRTTADDVRPIYICSHKRAGQWKTLDLIRNFHDSIPIYLVVAEAEIPEYSQHDNGPAELLAIPNGWAGYDIGVGRARQFCLYHGTMLRYPRIWVLDDDIMRLGYLYQSKIKSGANTGKECSGHSGLADQNADPLFFQKILALASKVADLTYQLEPNVIYGTLRKQHMSMHEENHKMMSMISRGMTPRQVVNYNLNRINRAGLSFDLTRWLKHSDDIGFMAQVLAAGKTSFMISSLIYDHYPESAQQSVLRTPETKKALHAKELEDLRAYPLGQRYLRVTAKDPEDGSYQYGDTDWRAYQKEPNMVPSRQIYWDGTIKTGFGRKYETHTVDWKDYQ